MQILMAGYRRENHQALTSSLAALAPDIVFGTDPTGPPDLILIDVGANEAEGRQGLHDVMAAFPDTPCVALALADDHLAMKDMLALGVRGFVTHAHSPDAMLWAIRLVLAGGIYIPPAHGTPTQVHSACVSHVLSMLTGRQVDVLRLLSEGKPNKLIARELGISEGTVKIHLAAIFRALGVHSRLEAVVAARRLGGM